MGAKKNGRGVEKAPTNPLRDMIGPSDSRSKRLRETIVLLIRHAETAAPDRFHGAESDVGLGERGRRQAEAVAGVLARREPSAIYSSCMRRALETAEPIARACGRPVEVTDGLHERRMGPLSGRRRDEGWAAYAEAKVRWMAGQLDFTHEGGESYAAIRRRALPAFQALAERHPGETIVIVAHGVVIRVVLTSLLEGHSPADFERIAIDYVAINDLRHDGSRLWAETLGAQVVGEESTGWSEGPSPS
jgi:2,3-bisphosphoglycerate-dependent phosphoglycerate mutase